MRVRKNALRDLIFGNGGVSADEVRRRRRKVVLSCDALEERVTPAAIGIAHHAIAHLHTHHVAATSGSTTSTSGSTTGTTVASNTSLSSTGSTTSSTGTTSTGTSTTLST